MNRHRYLSRHARLVAVVLLLSGFASAIQPPLTTTAKQVSGTSYTSPNYGYTITWQLPWYVVEDEVDPAGFDVVTIADSRSQVSFSGGRTGLGTPAAVIAQFQQAIQTDPDFQNFQSVDDPQCTVGSATVESSVACFRAELTYNDGSRESVGIFLKAWILGDGVDLLMSALTEEAILTGYIPHWIAFGVYPKGGVPLGQPGGCSVEMLHGIEFCFDQSLTDQDRSDISEGARLGQDAVARIISSDTTIENVHVTGLNATSPSGDGLVATTVGSSIAVYTGSKVWQNITPIERIESIVHEYFHIYQNSMTESTSTFIPQWFSEGSAESFGYTVVSQIGVTDQAEFYSLAFYKLSENPVVGDLQNFGTSIPMGADEYTLAYLAVQYLLGSKGMSIEALANVYQELRSGSTFDAAFAFVFGMSLEQFYVDFDTWRPDIPRVDTLDDDFYPKGIPASGATIDWRSFPGESHPGEQIVFVGQTDALASCELTIFVAGQSIRRDTWANGQGEVFWLLSLPDNIATGPGWLYVNCGGLPRTSVFGIS